MSKLSEYLSQLNTADNQWGIWVNPHNPTEEFRIGQYQFENGGIDDDWICIGSLENRSYGFQSWGEALTDWLEEHKDIHYNSNNDIAVIEYKGRKTLLSIHGIREAYDDTLNEDFNNWIDQQLEERIKAATEAEVDHFISNEMPEILDQSMKEKRIEGNCPICGKSFDDCEYFQRLEED